MGTLRSVVIRLPSRCTRSTPAGRGPASGERACARGAVFPRASAASSGVISRQARHTRSPWASSHASGGPHLSISVRNGGGTPTTAGSSGPSERPPRGVRTAALGKTTCRMGGWRLGSGAAIGGCWVVMGALPAPLSKPRPFPWGPSWGAGHPVYLPACPLVLYPSVPPVGPEGRDHPGEFPLVLGRPYSLAPPPARGRASGGPSRGGPSRSGGAWLWTGWWGRPRVAPLDGSVPRPAGAPSSRACSPVAGHELRARVQTLGRLLRLRLPHGRERGQGLLGLRP